MHFVFFPPPSFAGCVQGWNVEMLMSPSIPTARHRGCEWLQLAVQKLKSKPVLFHTWAWQNSASITGYFLGARAWQFKLQHTDEICVVGRKALDALEGVLSSGRARRTKRLGLNSELAQNAGVCVWEHFKSCVSHCFTIGLGGFSHSWNQTSLTLCYQPVPGDTFCLQLKEPGALTMNLGFID